MAERLKIIFSTKYMHNIQTGNSTTMQDGTKGTDEWGIT